MTVPTVFDPKIIVALDVSSHDAAMSIAAKLNPSLCRVKVGKELFTACGPKIVEDLMSKGFGVFLDLKFHDIQNTVFKAVKVAMELGVWMCNIHASGGRKMMKAAMSAVEGKASRPLIVGVTVLTSMDDDDLEELGINFPTYRVSTQVARLACLANKSGLDGVVASAQEAVMLRGLFRDRFLIVTPGIRLAGEDANDQVRVTTPEVAIESGADYVVIGRPVSEAKDPLRMLELITKKIS